MIDLLGAAFRKLTQVGGGSEVVPLIAFCVLVVLLGLGLGLAAMRLLNRFRSSSDAEPDMPQ
jgi:hypothetical protein